MSEAGNPSLLGGENVKRLIDLALPIVLSAEIRGTGLRRCIKMSAPDHFKRGGAVMWDRLSSRNLSPVLKKSFP